MQLVFASGKGENGYANFDESTANDDGRMKKEKMND